jgi:hypothetical protein
MAVFLLLVSMLPVAASPKGWRGIIPLHSTRADVERLLGPSRSGECKCRYYLNELNVFFSYSPGDCSSGRGGWDVPIDTVVWITVYPKPHPRLSDLDIDKTKLKARQGLHVEEFYFDNEEEGLTLEVYEGMVQAFIYGPTAKEQHLRCP